MTSFFILIFFGGIGFGELVFSTLIPYLKKILCFSAHHAGVIEDYNNCYDEKKVRRSKVFKERLKKILELIKIESKNGKHFVLIMYVQECHTDKEIRKVLRDRNFNTDHYSDGPNTIRISW